MAQWISIRIKCSLKRAECDLEHNGGPFPISLSIKRLQMMQGYKRLAGQNSREDTWRDNSIAFSISAGDQIRHFISIKNCILSVMWHFTKWVSTSTLCIPYLLFVRWCLLIGMYGVIRYFPQHTSQTGITSDCFALCFSGFQQRWFGGGFFCLFVCRWHLESIEVLRGTSLQLSTSYWELRVQRDSSVTSDLGCKPL